MILTLTAGSLRIFKEHESKLLHLGYGDHSPFVHLTTAFPFNLNL